jgi:hypothetical protein
VLFKTETPPRKADYLTRRSPRAILNESTKLRPSVFYRRAFFFGEKMTDAEILTLVDRLEHCLLKKDEFHHRDHLAVAAAYLYISDFEGALDRMCGSLKRFAAHHGVNGLYHETLTRFWLLQVEQRLDRRLALCECVRKVQEQLSDKELAFKYYSREMLNSAEARVRWIEPDMQGAMIRVLENYFAATAVAWSPSAL